MYLLSTLNLVQIGDQSGMCPEQEGKTFEATWELSHPSNLMPSLDHM